MSVEIVIVISLAVLILVVVGITGIGLISMFLVSENSLQSRLENFTQIPELREQEVPITRPVRFLRLRIRVNNFLSIFASRELRLKLISANWSITVSEFILVRMGVTILGFIVGWVLLRSPLSGMGAAIIAFLIPGIVLRRSLQNRRIKFANMLIDTLTLINGAVRSGYSLLQALDLVVEEAKPPVSEEFRRVTREVGLGITLSEALNNLAERMDNDDLNMIVTSININSQVGGNVSTMLDTVTNTIRERIRLFGELRVLTTHQRFTGYILSIMPFIIGGLLFVINPEYMSGLFDFICTPIFAVVGVILGNLIIQRLVKIKV